MSTPTLNEDAIAALFAAAEDGKLPEEGAGHEPRASQASVRRVDFRRPRQFAGEVQRRLRRTLDTFCRTASSRLSAEMRTAVDLEVIGVEQLTWSDAHGQLPASSLTAILATEPTKTKMLMGAEIGLMLSAIERMLGGPGEHAPPNRRLTDIDMMLAGQVFTTLIDQLSILWAELVDATITVESVLGQQQTAQLAPTSEPTLAFTLECKLLGQSTTLALLLPYRAIAPVIDRLAASESPDAGSVQSAQAMRHEIGAVNMQVRAEVGAIELSLAEVIAIREGDLLPLDGSRRTGVTLYVDDAVVGRGKPGRSGTRRAVQAIGAGKPLS